MNFNILCFFKKFTYFHTISISRKKNLLFNSKIEKKALEKLAFLYKSCRYLCWEGKNATW